MQAFAASVQDQKLQAKLMDILSGGKRIFRRFKDALSYDSQQLERYYAFIEERNRARIIDWLESIEFEVVVAPS